MQQQLTLASRRRIPFPPAATHLHIEILWCSYPLITPSVLHCCHPISEHVAAHKPGVTNSGPPKPRATNPCQPQRVQPKVYSHLVVMTTQALRDAPHHYMHTTTCTHVHACPANTTLFTITCCCQAHSMHLRNPTPQTQRASNTCIPRHLITVTKAIFNKTQQMLQRAANASQCSHGCLSAPHLTPAPYASCQLMREQHKQHQHSKSAAGPCQQHRTCTPATPMPTPTPVCIAT